MPHYKRMYDDKEHIYAFDLDGRDVTLTIEKVFAGEVQGEKGRKSKKPVIKFVGKDKKLAVNKTNGKTIAQLYGTDTDGWLGKAITLYPTTTDFGGDTVECIRVRPQRPEQRQNGQRGSKNNAPQREAPVTSEPDEAEAAEIRAMEAKQQS